MNEVKQPAAKITHQNGIGTKTEQVDDDQNHHKNVIAQCDFPSPGAFFYKRKSWGLNLVVLLHFLP
ncbi:hypothetical protein SDC9_180483 [bioreactor metagenome]|uniref:Uncharacterized protein n=1 Tax=bioreactor metagenome TaxID=1076179 RepID=A0A645H2V1_9ZZZZ